MSWYKQQRNLFDRPWAKDPKMVSVYAYLHCRAYVRDQPLNGVMIRRGSCPTSRSAIMEGTGMSEYDVKSRLRKLLECGEIIIKSSNLGTIVTLCDYDSYSDAEDLFGFDSSNGLPDQLPNGLPSQLPTYIDNKKEDNVYSLRTHYVPSKTREKEQKALADEIKALYNKTFEGKLPEWQRMSEKMARKVNRCIEHYGRQSIDIVFEQILHESFALGENRTGFIAEYDHIFELDHFEKYLARYKLRHSKKPQPQQEQKQKQGGVGVVEDQPQRSPKSQDERRRTLQELVDYVRSNPRSISCGALEEAYRSGELQKYGIDWKPNNE